MQQRCQAETNRGEQCRHANAEPRWMAWGRTAPLCPVHARLAQRRWEAAREQPGGANPHAGRVRVPQHTVAVTFRLLGGP